MWFGYYNRNTEEHVNVPVGPNNKFDLPTPDQGQPAYFYPGYHQFVFRVDLPKDWADDKKVVWTLIANGVALTANGSTIAGYEVDEGVIADESLFAGWKCGREQASRGCWVRRSRRSKWACL